jgi:hypothetical protein
LQNQTIIAFLEEEMEHQSSARFNSRSILKIVAVILVTSIFAGLYWYGASLQMTDVNTGSGYIDQDAYMQYAIDLYESHYTYIGDHNRMPVYPFLQSLFYHPKLRKRIYFQEGQLRNLILSLPLLAVLAIIFFHRFKPLHAFNSILIIAFTIFIFKAGWFQAELLFYFLNFIMFFLMWRILQRPSYLLAILAGLTAGIAHLTKASILPGLVIWFLVAGLQFLWLAFKNRSQLFQGGISFLSKTRVWAIPITGLVFLATIFPYIQTSKRVYGSYFYNVNSTFYIWYDSWEQATNGTKAHGDRVGWPDMPADEIPSMSKYLREHTGTQILMRFVNGAQAVLDQAIHSYGYFKYITLYASFLLLVAIFKWKRARELIRNYLFLILFASLYFVVYFLLYFWYAPITSDNRLILAQFIPLFFTISTGLHALLSETQLQIGKIKLHALTAINLAVLCVLSVDIYVILTIRIGQMIGGK